MHHAAAALLLLRWHGYVQAINKCITDGEIAEKTNDQASKITDKIDAWSANSEAQAASAEGIGNINSLLFYSYVKILILVREGQRMGSLRGVGTPAMISKRT